MRKQTKNLSLSTVKKQNASAFKELKRVHLTSGGFVDLDVVFRPTKITATAQELLAVFKESFESHKKIDATIGVLLSTALLIKNFTSLETDASGYDGLLALFNELQDGKYVEEIVAGFEKAEIEKLFEELKQATDNLVLEIDRLVAAESKNGRSDRSELVEAVQS
ncbi:hypothetical protein K0T92_04900 [Paenibacillus oenotherae]|uniref:Uncharacterized protein n=1 Tax=Paenibacillus oenotherae TaxID=1435645 RepID=A0ABS7D2P2_9BACL|nr:hypothetical protein [Paenibacillus oenotherae]MBW7474071.1 hypothetical protein [Paenibacillus oenotherae]